MNRVEKSFTPNELFDFICKYEYIMISQNNGPGTSMCISSPVKDIHLIDFKNYCEIGFINDGDGWDKPLCGTRLAGHTFTYIYTDENYHLEGVLKSDMMKNEMEMELYD